MGCWGRREVGRDGGAGAEVVDGGYGREVDGGGDRRGREGV